MNHYFSITIITFYEIATRRMEIKMNNDTLDTSRWKKRNIYGRLNALCANAFPALRLALEGT